MAIFLRRIGLKEYVKTFVDYGVDGSMLLKLDDEDYFNLGLTSRVLQKKIEVELERVLPVRDRAEMTAEQLFLSRERLRMARLREEAALMIQSNYRVYLAREEVKRIQKLAYIVESQKMLKRKIETSAPWWTEHDVPSMHIQPIPVIRFDQLGSERVTARVNNGTVAVGSD